MDVKKFEVKNNLHDVDVREVTLCKSPAVPDGKFVLLKIDDTQIPEDHEVVMKAMIFKATDKVKKQVFGYCLVPDIADSQGDAMTAEEVEKAAHMFMRNLAVEKNQRGTAAGLEHTAFEGIGYPIETIIDTDGSIAKSHGAVGIAGGWWIGLQVESDEIWKSIEAGDLTGFSVGGYGKRDPIEKKNLVTDMLNLIHKKTTAIAKKMNLAKDAASFAETYMVDQLQDELWQMTDALMCSIWSIVYDDDIEDKKAALAESVNQFRDALLSFMSVIKTGQENVTANEDVLADLNKVKHQIDAAVSKYNHSTNEEGNEPMTEEQIKKMEDGMATSITEKVAASIGDTVKKAVGDAIDDNKTIKKLREDVDGITKRLDGKPADGDGKDDVTKNEKTETLEDLKGQLIEVIEKVNKLEDTPTGSNQVDPPVKTVTKTDDHNLEPVEKSVAETNKKFEGTAFSFSGQK